MISGPKKLQDGSSEPHSSGSSSGIYIAHTFQSLRAFDLIEAEHPKVLSQFGLGRHLCRCKYEARTDKQNRFVYHQNCMTAPFGFVRSLIRAWLNEGPHMYGWRNFQALQFRQHVPEP